ncbi:MAG: hypothetical protein JWO78_1873 [Micavibrio sp.]|nr:hypothetical protein [Micavibrio sp.]
MTKDRNPLNNLHMPYARYFPDGAEKPDLVQPTRPNERPAQGYVAYNPDLHKGKMKCPHCDIRADFTNGSGATIAGDNLWGSRPHMRKQPSLPHEESCILPLLENKKNTVYDPAAGYRIHLKGPWSQANDGLRDAPLYERGQDFKIRIRDTRLAGMQPVKVESVQELIRLIRLADPARLKQSLFINRQTIVPYEDFIVRYDEQSGHESFRNLVKRLRNGVSHPVLMEMRMYRPVNSHLAAAEAIHIDQPDRKGRHHDIVPYVHLNDTVIDAMPSRGLYLVMGTPALFAEPTARKVEHIIEMNVTSVNQVAQAELSALERQAEAHQIALAIRRMTRQPG